MNAPVARTMSAGAGDAGGKPTVVALKGNRVVVPLLLTRLLGLLEADAPLASVAEEIGSLGVGYLPDAELVRFLDIVLRNAGLAVDPASCGGGGPFRFIDLRLVSPASGERELDRVRAVFELLPSRRVYALAVRCAVLFRLPVLLPVALATLLALVPLGIYGLSHLRPTAHAALGTDAAAFGLALLLLFGAGAVHELGHAAALAHGGERPGEIGVGFYWGVPVLFCNVDAVWSLPPRQRLLVNLGGVYFQGIYTVAVAGALQAFGAPGLALAGSTFAAMSFLAMVSALNPAGKFDGYWIVCDAFGLPNLRPRCLALLKTLRTRHWAAPEQRRLMPYLLLMLGYPLALMLSALASLWSVARQPAGSSPQSWVLIVWSGCTLFFCGGLLLQWWRRSRPDDVAPAGGRTTTTTMPVAAKP